MTSPCHPVTPSPCQPRGARFIHRKERSDKRDLTGVPGISVLRSACNRHDGTVQTYFVVCTHNARGEKLRRRHCVDTLGKEEAWRRALRDRAEHERTVAGRRAAAPTGGGSQGACRQSRPGTLRSKTTQTQAQPA